MTIGDIESNRILPFEIEDKTLQKIFSFFLHSAPSIKSANAMEMDEERLVRNWSAFKEKQAYIKFGFLASNAQMEMYIEKYGLTSESIVKRKTSSCICKKESPKKKDGVSVTEYRCFLRHIRNAIAHGNVFLSSTGNRKYILFINFHPDSGNLNAKILLSQNDLVVLKREISK